VKAAQLLVAAFRDPATTRGLDEEGWTALLTAARPERLLGTLGARLAGEDLRPDVRTVLKDARVDAAHARTAALWEAEMTRRALEPLGIRTVLLKGAAYAAAGLSAAEGRTIGDLDILVPRGRIAEAEAALLAAGWEGVKTGDYDQRYYRDWMHELPPLIHRERDRMIDVHHTILPLTHRRRPDPAALLARSVAAGRGFFVLGLEDMIVHASAHLIADGDLAGGLRNLWDVHCLLRQLERDHVVEHGSKAGLDSRLRASAQEHDLTDAVGRACRLSVYLYGDRQAVLDPLDRAMLRRLLARDGWGRARRPATRLAFTVREHWMRMPPLMLARHLFRKATRPA